jgi:hypothetical protein
MKNSSEFSVPLAALALPGEQEGQTTAPAMGDVVDFNGTAKVTRIDGDKAILTPETINGQAIEAAAKPENLDDEETEMREQAKKDQASGNGDIY